MNNMNRSQNKQIKSGIVTLVGPPNTGKSTLLNALLNQKISIVSPKPQTTRNRILGIVNAPDYQIVLLDTPGLHHSECQLNQEMVKTAMDTMGEVDIIVFMIDATAHLPEGKAAPTKYLAGVKSTPAFLLINKIDLIDKEKILPLINTYAAQYNFKAIIPISALKRQGLDLLIDELRQNLPEGPRYYPEDIPTNATERFIVEEIIREKVFLLTSKEVPYSTAVQVEQFKENSKRRLTTIHASIIIEKKSQKGIIIGKGGKKLGQIGTSARIDIEKLLNQKVMLKLWVKVKKNWTQNPGFLKELGFG